MKSTPIIKFSIFIFLLSISNFTNAQISVTIIESHSISCNGANDGELTANVTVIGGSSSYTILWSPGGETTQTISGLSAGNYSVTVSNGNTDNDNFSLQEPSALSLVLNPSIYNCNYNITSDGGDDGSVRADVYGGTPPYTYQWSNGGIQSTIGHLIAGTYSVDIFDANGCSITTNNDVTLTDPDPIQIINPTFSSYNGFGISCYGGGDGSISIQIAGGCAPFTFLWSNGSASQNLIDLRAGTYSVTVTDDNGASITSPNYTLFHPDEIVIQTTPFVYPNTYNISCHNCFNGSISSAVTGGVSPYTYLWILGGQPTQNISSLGEGTYTLTVTDDNGCVQVSGQIKLKQPDREDWRINGNTGIDHAANFLGTTDQADLVIKTNLSERMRVTMDGKVGIGTDMPSDALDVVGQVRIRNVSGGSTNAINLLKVDQIGIVDKVSPSSNPSSEILLGNGSWGDINSLIPGGNLWTESNGDISNTNNGTVITAGPMNVKGTDLDLGDPANMTREVSINTDRNIALVHDVGDLLTINYGDGYSGGVKISGSSGLGIGTNPTFGYRLTVAGNVDVSAANPVVAVSGTGTTSAALNLKNTNGFWHFSGPRSETNNPMSIFWNDGSTFSRYFNILDNGNVGIGKIPASGYLLDMSSKIGFDAKVRIGSPNQQQASLIVANGQFGYGFGIDNDNLGHIYYDANQLNSAMTIANDGRISIGNSSYIPNGFQLAVHGDIIAQEFVVRAAGSWPDFVFESGYDLKDINQVSAYIKKHKHLEGIPSAKEVESSGTSLGKIVSLQMQKIEELTLYIIQLQEDIDELKRTILK